MKIQSRTLRIGLALLIIAAASSFSTRRAAQAAEPIASGIIAASTGGMQRLGKLTLSSSNYSHLYNAVIDPVNGYAYFTTAGGINVNPGWIIKVDIKGALPIEVGATHVMTDEVNLNGGAIDVGAGYAYFGTTGAPAHIVKIALGAGSNPPSYVGSLTLNSGEDRAGSAVVDTRDPDPANHYLYFATGTSPGYVVKVAPGAGNALPTRVAALQLSAGEDNPRRGVVDLSNGYAYFATAFNPSPTVIKVGLTGGNNPPTHVGAVDLEPGTPYTYSIGSAVIDAANGYAYFGTYNNVSNLVPAKVYKVALGAGNAMPTLVGSLTLDAGERELSTALIDPANGFAYFGTDHTYPAKIFQIQLGAGAALPIETGVLQLQGGTQSNPPDGQNVNNSPETLYGEVFLQSSVIDLSRGYAYFGTDSNHGQVVKVALPSVPVTDLRVTNAITATGTLTATLAWTPPGNAVTTTLRYSDTLITEANWASALLLTDTLTGTAIYTATIAPYNGGTIYFVLKTQDGTGAYSILSNNAFWPHWEVYLPVVRR